MTHARSLPRSRCTSPRRLPVTVEQLASFTNTSYYAWSAWSDINSSSLSQGSATQ